MADEAGGGPLHPDVAAERGQTLRLSGQILAITGNLRPPVALPTPVAQPSGNSPEDHLRKKPGRTVVTDLAIIAENGLWETGGMLPTPDAYDGDRAVTLLPTPKSGDADFGLPRTSGRPPERSTHLATRLHYTDFGIYTPAIVRWERVLGRSAPSPTELSKTGKPQLSPRFTEWMMGWPDGWVTECGLSRNEALRACGNGVVPQQAAWAVRECLKGKGDSGE